MDFIPIIGRVVERNWKEFVASTHGVVGFVDNAKCGEATLRIFSTIADHAGFDEVKCLLLSTSGAINGLRKALDSVRIVPAIDKVREINFRRNIEITKLSKNIFSILSNSFKSIEWLMNNNVLEKRNFVVKPLVWISENGVPLGPLSSVLLKISGISKVFALGKSGVSLVVNVKWFYYSASWNIGGREHLYCIVSEVVKISLIIFSSVMFPIVVDVVTLASGVYSKRVTRRERLETEKANLENQKNLWKNDLRDVKGEDHRAGTPVHNFINSVNAEQQRRKDRIKEIDNELTRLNNSWLPGFA